VISIPLAKDEEWERMEIPKPTIFIEEFCLFYMGLVGFKCI
jgi:hypothetical protein